MSSSEPLRPVYLLTGSDRPKIKRALARLRARFPPESIEHVAAEAAEGADVVAAVNAVGLFGGEGDAGRLVIVDGVERWRADDVEAVAAYLESPTPGNVLALVADAPKVAAALTAAAERGGQVLRFDVPKPRDPSVWVRSEFERLGARVDADGARALVEVVGDDVLELAAEVEKVATWAGGAAIGRADVEALAVGAHGTFVWTLTDAWGRRDVGGVLAAAESLLETRTREPFGIAAALAGYVGRVRAAQALRADGLSTGDIAKRLRMKEYPARKAVEHGANYTRDEVDAAVVRLAALDAALKGASRLPPELELERALVEVTAAREPAAA